MEIPKITDKTIVDPYLEEILPKNLVIYENQDILKKLRIDIEKNLDLVYTRRLKKKDWKKFLEDNEINFGIKTESLFNIKIITESEYPLEAEITPKLKNKITSELQRIQIRYLELIKKISEEIKPGSTFGDLKKNFPYYFHVLSISGVLNYKDEEEEIKKLRDYLFGC